jgi:hypothetical protein
MIGVGFVNDRGGRVVLDTARGVGWALDAEVHATTVVGPSNWASAASGIGWKAAAAATRMVELPGVHGAALAGRPDRALAALSGTLDRLVIGSRHRSLVRRLLARRRRPQPLALVTLPAPGRAAPVRERPCAARRAAQAGQRVYCWLEPRVDGAGGELPP